MGNPSSPTGIHRPDVDHLHDGDRPWPTSWTAIGPLRPCGRAGRFGRTTPVPEPSRRSSAGAERRPPSPVQSRAPGPRGRGTGTALSCCTTHRPSVYTMTSAREELSRRLPPGGAGMEGGGGKRRVVRRHRLSRRAPCNGLMSSTGRWASATTLRLASGSVRVRRPNFERFVGGPAARAGRHVDRADGSRVG